MKRKNAPAAADVADSSETAAAPNAQGAPEASVDVETSPESEGDDPDAEGVEVTVEVEPPSEKTAEPSGPRPAVPRPGAPRPPGALPVPNKGDKPDDDRSQRAAEELGI